MPPRRNKECFAPDKTLRFSINTLGYFLEKLLISVWFHLRFTDMLNLDKLKFLECIIVLIQNWVKMAFQDHWKELFLDMGLTAGMGQVHAQCTQVQVL